MTAYRFILKYNMVIGLVIGLFFVGKVDSGPTFAVPASIGCTVVCGAGWIACLTASGAVDVALLACPITAPFAGLLAPLFASGCGAGYGACMAACVGAAVVAPTP